ncbi:monocarboxylate transporter 10 [Diachasma alloeum]|uniref:monocarboxylate transporter 10 n=1 Tax=Diachasma alloeum TaxID=454923 RepID=UPI00073813BE|nr:monocarboxylate transporter 10 [Diachasma alloeum]
MLVDECGGASVGWGGPHGMKGGWSTPGGCRNSAMSFTGSVPSLHPAGSIRSLRSQHSQVPETPRRCHHCHPVHVATPNNYVPHTPVQYYTPSHCMDGHNGTYTPHRGNSYHGDPRLRCMDMDESMAGNTNWVLGDLRSLHRCVPALRRTGLDVTTIRTHFYPEGGWGWLVCAAGFLALLLTTGMQLAFGLLHLYAIRHLGEANLMNIAWAGALSAAVSRGSAPLVVGACRRGSTRLTAVIGGFVFALASLFTSFALHMHQVVISYGLVLGAGAGLVRETAGLILGHYFKKRREFVEMVVQAGTGVGIALFSVFYKEAVGGLGWRLGLQSVTGALSLTFFLGLIYRSASLYHPQRRAIVHLKNQRTKVKEKKNSTNKMPRQPFVDLSPLGSRPVRMLMLAAGSAAFGLYTPAFYIVLQGFQSGLEISSLVLLQSCLGLAAALGCAAWGSVTARPSAQCLVSRQYLCQGALVGVALAQIALGSVEGYHGLVLASGLYGASLGGALYSLKMLALERLRARHFARSWALVQAAEALPILLGVPLTGYMNASIPRVGYYACTLSSLCGAGLLFLVGWGRQPSSPVLHASQLSHVSQQLPPPCACPPPPRQRLPKSQSLHVPLDVEQEMRDQPQTPLHPQYHEMPEHNCIHSGEHHYCQSVPYHHHHTLRPSKSVPEGLHGNHDTYRPRPRRYRDVTVIEQITTSV